MGNGIGNKSVLCKGTVVRKRMLPPSKEAGACVTGRTPGGAAGAAGTRSPRILHAEEPKLCLTVNAGIEDSRSKGREVKSEF